MSKNDGGSAFPNSNGMRVVHSGMTLRDWFAGQALIGIVTSPHSDPTLGPKIMALASYEMADAMLEARK